MYTARKGWSTHKLTAAHAAQPKPARQMGMRIQSRRTKRVTMAAMSRGKRQ